MKIENFYYQSSNGIDNVYAAVFEPDNAENIIGIIQVVHGMCEYMDRYKEFASYMTLKGFVVCGEDHLGHGKTAKPGKLGIVDENDTEFNLVRDVRRLHNIMRNRYGKNIPYHLFGHSMGSFIVRLYMGKYSTKDIASVVLCGTSGNQPLADKAMKLLEIDMAINGSGSKSVVLDKILFKQGEGAPEFREGIFEMINSNNAETERKRDDPYFNFLFSNRAFYIMFLMVSKISRDEWYKSLDKNLKILLISGEFDAVGGFGRGVREVYDKLCAVGIKSVDYRLYKDARHEIFTEDIRLSVFENVYEFISED